MNLREFDDLIKRIGDDQRQIETITRTANERPRLSHDRHL